MTLNYLQKMKKNWILSYTQLEYTVRTYAVRIYSQDIRMEFRIEKCAMLVMKSGKRHMTDGMKLRNISEERENYSRQNSPAKTSSKE